MNFAIAGLPLAARSPMMNFESLKAWAEEETRAVVKILPKEVKEAAGKCAVSYETKPAADQDDDDLKGDELGVFVGASHDEIDGELPPRIRLFLSNVWEWVEEDEQDFRDEVGTVYLNELGLFLDSIGG
ncbi:metallopeptidase family protein [Luteolibacter pohnpeiensis]|uniref:Metallopeptidase family protein n=1 Tax=Luteolibacter pohnpeiensis TaxID=454153 RepID=A0A934VUB8_9BACT|nr:metallopeptidase family protein [Luteolibacter pohnpeiensis]MBK1880970.1 metallopeptidase family protein [Luteolibacter pohnpeiensis]